VADPRARERRAKIEQRAESTQVLHGHVHRTRPELDGTMARAAEEMRRRYAF
jgi:hypothetical protein